MTAQHVFILSALIGWAGVVGFTLEHTFGRMSRSTRWSELTTRQWVFVYMMVQFAAAIVVMVLYHAVKRAA